MYSLIDVNQIIQEALKIVPIDFYGGIEGNYVKYEGTGSVNFIPYPYNNIVVTIIYRNDDILIWDIDLGEFVSISPRTRKAISDYGHLHPPLNAVMLRTHDYGLEHLHIIANIKGFTHNLNDMKALIQQMFGIFCKSATDINNIIESN